MTHENSPRRSWASDLLFWLLVLLAVGIRLRFVPELNSDLTIYLGPWHRTAQEYGLRALGMEFTDYPPLFSYLILLVSPLPFPFAVKLLSIVFDFVAAWLMRRLVRLKYEDPRVGRLAFLSVLFAPTVILNGSYWGESDILFSTFLLACVLCAVERRPWMYILSLSTAVALKLQSVFLLPFSVLLAVRRRIPWSGFALIPSIYLLAALPCIWFGRSVSSVLGVYKDQAEFGRSLLVFNAPNFYQFVPNRFYDIFLILGIGTSAILGSLVPLLGRRRQVEMSPATLLEAAVLSVSTMAFFLPKMRARYFFPADLLSIALAFYQPRLFFVPLVFQFTSAFSYTGHLWHRVFVRHWILALLNGWIVLFLFWDFYRTMRRSHLNAADRQ